MAYGGGGAAVAVEPKWATVSSYCKRHGVNRGPVQCRKRWSNLAGDFKKIKEWESQIKDESDSFWVMRNDLRRERKLPGFFDKEVYDILDGPPLSLSVPPAEDKDGDQEEDGEAEAVFDSGRSAAADDGLFSDFEQSAHEEMGRSPITRDTRPHINIPDKEAPPATPTPTTHTPVAIPAPTPISEKQYQPFTAGTTDPVTNERQPALNREMGSTSHEGRKRRRFLSEEDAEEEAEEGPSPSPSLRMHDQLVDVMERNGRILSAQLDAHNINLKLDREERKDHAASLVSVLNKLADALGRIADKL